MPITIPSNRTITLASKTGGGFQSAGLVFVPSAGWKGNEPAGFTAHPALTFDDTVENTSGWAAYDVENLQYVTDPASPSPGQNVGRLIYPNGRSGGGAFVNIGAVVADSIVRKSVYFCIGIKMSANFQYHLTGVNKLFFINVSGYLGGGDPFVAMIDSDFDPPILASTIQGHAPRVFARNPAGEMVKDEWYIFEGVLGMNTAGNADGTYEQWVTRVSTAEAAKTHDLSDVEYVNAVYDFNLPKLQPTWGGSGDTTDREFYLDVSELYTSWSET